MNFRKPNGVAPQALLAVRLVFAELCSLDLISRDYFVIHVATADRGGRENIARVDAPHLKNNSTCRRLW